jgi:copper chaperone CopZ
MHCESCVGRVETALLRLAGVTDAEVNLAEHKAKISYDSGRLGIDDLIASIEAEGYHVPDENQKDSELKAECCNESSFSWFSNPRSYLYGALASIALVGVYLGMNTLTADWYFARVQFSEYRWWILPCDRVRHSGDPVHVVQGPASRPENAGGQIDHGRLRGHVRYCDDGLLLPLPCNSDTDIGCVVSISSGSGKYS